MDNCDFYVTKDFLPEARAVVSACRERTRAPIVVGGSAVGVMPAAVLETVGADWAIAGDGEVAIVRFVEALEAGADPSGIPGVCTPGAEGVRVNAPSPVPVLDSSPLPRVFRWVDVNAYLRYEGVYPLQSKRGCALKCVYCTYVNIEGSRYRFRSGKSVVDEVEEIYRKTGTRDFEFVDSTFNAPPHHAMDICNELIERRLPVRFIGNGMNPVATTPKLLSAMRRAGFHSLVSTAESASDTVLGNLRKGFTRAHLEQVAKDVHEAGLPTLWIFLVGGPGETRETVRETLDFFHEHTGPRDVAFVTNGVRIYPNTALETIALEQGVIGSRDELVEPRFYFSPELDDVWLRDEMIASARRDPRLITAERSQSRLVPLGLRVLSTLGVRKPFWRFAPFLNRALRWVG